MANQTPTTMRAATTIEVYTYSQAIQKLEFIHPANTWEKFNRPLQILNVPVPTPAPDQILVRVLASSLCNSDIAGWMGIVGAITPYCGGHERV